MGLFCFIKSVSPAQPDLGEDLDEGDLELPLSWRPLSEGETEVAVLSSPPLDEVVDMFKGGEDALSLALGSEGVARLLLLVCCS